MTIIALTHHCLAGMHFEWLLQNGGSLVFLDMIYSFSPLCPMRPPLIVLEAFQSKTSWIVPNLTAQQTTDPTQVWRYCEGHYNLRLISETLPALQGDSARSKRPAESWGHCPDSSPWESPNEQQEMCWTQWINTARITNLCPLFACVSPVPTPVYINFEESNLLVILMCFILLFL